jgi:exodeoxyribonuclease V alpha subunit
VVTFQSHNVSTLLATKIYRAYGNRSVEVVQDDPYQLADDMVGIGFRTVDKIAQQLGFDMQSPKRYRCGIQHILKEQANNAGHCFGLRTQVGRGGGCGGAGLLAAEWVGKPWCV